MASETPLPLHLVTEPNDPRPVVRKGGRPRKVRLAPRADAVAYAQTINTIRERSIETNALVRVLEDVDDLDDCVTAIKVELAQETASLNFESRQAIEAGRDPTTYSVRRIDGLAKLASITGTAARLGVRRGLDKDVLLRLQEFFISTVEGVARETAPDVAAALVAKLRASITCEGNDRSEGRSVPRSL